MVKSGIKMYANALCEVTSLGVREILHKHLNKSIEMQQKLIDFMIDKGYCFPSNMKKQINLDIEEVDKFTSSE
jgi:similar to spore coat protein